MDFDGMEIFTGTKHTDREALGRKVTDWRQRNGSKIEVTEIRTVQSSDNEFHCTTILIFYKNKK